MADIDRAVAAVQQHAFAALLTEETPSIAAIAETASRDTLGVAQAVAWLDGHGRLERDGELLVGAHGLTRRTTAHALTIEGRALHTWCAYDAVAIPVALGATARATTTCLTCRRPLVVDVDNGCLPDTAALPDTVTPVLWLPTGPCEHVIHHPQPDPTLPPSVEWASPTRQSEACTRANLFCSPEHLNTWRQAAGDPPGRVVTLAEVPALARTTWADITTHP